MWVLAIIFFLTSVYLFVPWYKRYRSIKTHRKEYEAADSKLECIYTDSFGNNWYGYKNVLDMAPLRGIRAEVASRMARLCLTDEMFDKYVAQIKSACNHGDLVRVAGLVDRMSERRLRPAEIETIKSLADAYFLLEGENPKETSEYWFDKKKEIWSKDQACMSFFFHEAFKQIRNAGQLSQSDLLNYLLTQQVEDQLSRI